jgi:tetratricopeptide (TPR) repeat protein
MQYDRAEYEAAAKTLEEAAKPFQGKPKDGIDQEIIGTGRTVDSVLARMHFFRGCQYEAAGQRDKQLEELKAGLEQDPTDVDVLIALFHLPNLEAALRDKARKLIRDSAENYRQQIKETPDDPTPYNQFAWLIANTEGDKQEALRASQKSLELRPGAAGFLDTLGRCYFAAGDVENAVKHQAKAVELDPHSGQMNRQLKLFREALEKSKAKQP